MTKHPEQAADDRIRVYQDVRVVGLFNSFTVTQGASIPPLAIAFMVGYAVDVFFSFLEGLLQAFTKTKTAAIPQAGGAGRGRQSVAANPSHPRYPLRRLTPWSRHRLHYGASRHTDPFSERRDQEWLIPYTPGYSCVRPRS